MNTLAVFRREWIGKRNLFLLATGEGLLLLFAYLYDPAMRAGSDKGAAMAVFGSLMFVWVCAALFGATMIGKELEERRFGFFLNRPLHPAEIFFGKVTAGLAQALLAGLLTCLPWLLGGGWQGLALVEAGRLVSAWLLGGLFLLLLLHAVSIQARSKAPWLLLDLAAWGGCLWGCWSLFRKLALSGVGFEHAVRFAGGVFAAMTLGLLVSGYLQVAQGRSDLRRGHRWVSLAMALTIGVTLFAGWGYTTWAIHSGAKTIKAVAHSRGK